MDFYAEWCNPCRKIAPEVERLAENNLDVIFLRANVDKSKELLKQYKVSSLPHFVFIKNHKEVRIDAQNYLSAISHQPCSSRVEL